MMKMDLIAEEDVSRAPACTRSTCRARAIPTMANHPAVLKRLADYLEMTKPRIAVMALFTWLRRPSCTCLSYLGYSWWKWW